MQVKKRKEIDALKERVRKSFSKYEERKLQREGNQGVPNMLSKEEIKKMLGAIIVSNNDISENYFREYDKD